LNNRAKVNNYADAGRISRGSLKFDGSRPDRNLAMSKLLLIVTAVVEVATGLALLVAPAWVVELLLGAGLTSPQSAVLGRITGAALISIGVSCGTAAVGERSQIRGLIASLLLYNFAVPILLIHAEVSESMRGIALWPGVVLHTGLAIWCALCLRSR
jgi:hypothetical protein